MRDNTLDLIKHFPQKLKAPLTSLYKRDAIDDALLNALADAAELTKMDMQLMHFALGVQHMRAKAVPILDALRMAREQNRRINLHWTAKRWKEEHDRLSRFETLKRLAESATIYDLTPFRAKLPTHFKGYLVPTSRKLGAEGLRQRHCVASWHDRILQGRVAIASVFVNGTRYTVELINLPSEKQLYIGQVRGRFNTIPSAKDKTTIYEMLGIEITSTSSPGSPSTRIESGAQYTPNLHRVIPLLQALGIGRACVSFDGSGDSGCIDSVTFYDREGMVITNPEGSVPVLQKRQTFESQCWVSQTVEEQMCLSDAIEHIVDDWLDETGVDWYNDDGGFGECIIDVASAEITMDINIRISETEGAYYQEYSFDELAEMVAEIDDAAA